MGKNTDIAVKYAGRWKFWKILGSRVARERKRKILSFSRTHGPLVGKHLILWRKVKKNDRGEKRPIEPNNWMKPGLTFKTTANDKTWIRTDFD